MSLAHLENIAASIFLFYLAYAGIHHGVRGLVMVLRGWRHTYQERRDGIVYELHFRRG